jgi:hypothetical protein
LVLHPVEDGSDCVFGFVYNSFVGFFEQFGDTINFLALYINIIHFFFSVFVFVVIYYIQIDLYGLNTTTGCRILQVNVNILYLILLVCETSIITNKIGFI